MHSRFHILHVYCQEYIYVVYTCIVRVHFVLISHPIDAVRNFILTMLSTIVPNGAFISMTAIEDSIVFTRSRSFSPFALIGDRLRLAVHPAAVRPSA